MKQILINLAVKDLDKSMGFYTALGFTTDFSDDTEKRMVWSETISVMIMTHEKFATFATKPIADTKSTMAGYFSLLVSSVDELNNSMANGLNAGGTEPNEMSDYGFMQQEPSKILTDTLGILSLWTSQKFLSDHKQEIETSARHYANPRTIGL